MPQRKTNNFLVLLALWLMVFSASSQVIIIAPILPRIGEVFQVSEALLSLLVTAYSLLLALFAVITGPISDKIGRRRILLIGTSFMAGSLLLHGVVDSYAGLLVVRGLAGIGGGMLSGGAVAYIGDYFPYERRGWANGWVMSGMAVGQIIGIPLGTILAELFTFRVPFLMFAGTMVIAWLLIWNFLPQPDVQRDPNRLTLKRAGLNYWSLLRDRETFAAVIAFFLMFFSLGLYVVYLPTWIERALNVSGTEIASLFFAGGLANVLTGPLAGRVSDRVGRKPLVVTSCLGLGLVMVLTTYIVTDMWVAYLFFALAMMMVAMRLSPLQALMTALVADHRRGILMSLAVAIGQLGIGLGSPVAGLTYTEYGYLSNTVMATVAIVAMAVLIQYFLPEPDLGPTLATESSSVAGASSS